MLQAANNDIESKMALRLKKDIKKASYYVWFLGAQESRGLRGEEFALPAIQLLEDRARELEPFKVTLQVSARLQPVKKSCGNCKLFGHITRKGLLVAFGGAGEG